MKLMATALVSLTFSATAFASDVYQCHALYDSKGSLTLVINDNNTVTATGSYISDDKTIGVDCQSEEQYNNMHGYSYYDVNRGDSCPADFVRVSDELKINDEGRFSLVRTDGDRHDWSGYEYVYFSCAK